MTELRVRFEHLQAVRDSLAISNLRSRLELVTAVRPDKVSQALADQGFAVPLSGRLRFVLYPKSVSIGQGGLTPRLSGLVVTEEQRHQTNSAQRNRLEEVPYGYFFSPDSGWQNAR